MKRFTFILMFCLTAATSAIMAQNQPEQATVEGRAQWLREVREYKHDFIKQELSLTRDQERKFFEIYDKMQDELNALNSDTRDLERKVMDEGDAATDLEYDVATQAMVDLKGKECEIEKGYYEQFKNILTKKQLFKLRKAERDFSMKMMRRHHQLRNQRQQ